ACLLTAPHDERHPRPMTFATATSGVATCKVLERRSTCTPNSSCAWRRSLTKTRFASTRANACAAPATSTASACPASSATGPTAELRFGTHDAPVVTWFEAEVGAPPTAPRPLQEGSHDRLHPRHGPDLAGTDPRHGTR